MADEIGVAQHGLAFIFEHVAVQFQDDVVDGQRAGLVGAQHVHRAEVLDGVEPLDDDLFLDMASAPLERQTETIIGSISGVEPDGHGQGEEERVLPVVLREAVDEEDHRHHHQHE